MKLKENKTDTPIIIIGAALIIIGHGEKLIDSYANPINPLLHYEVIKRSDDGKVSIVPTSKSLSK